MVNVKGGSVIAVVATIDPQTITVTELFSDVVDMSKWDQVMAIGLTGDLASSTVDLKCYPCDANGSNAQASVSSNTQRTADVAQNDGIQLVNCVFASQLAASGKRYCKFGAVLSGTGGPAGVIVLGLSPRLGAISDIDLASVVEVKQ